MWKERIGAKTHDFLTFCATQHVNNHVGIDRTAQVGDGCTIGHDVSVGRHSFLGPSCFFRSGSVGAFCSIGPNVVIGVDEHPHHTVSTHLFWHNQKTEDVWPQDNPPPVIRNDVWVGAGAIILRGAVVEDGAVIAAGAVVKGHVPLYGIVGGVPAKLIRYRFDDTVRQVLQKSKWWEWDDDKLSEMSRYFADVNEFICKLSSPKEG